MRQDDHSRLVIAVASKGCSDTIQIPSKGLLDMARQLPTAERSALELSELSINQLSDTQLSAAESSFVEL